MNIIEFWSTQDTYGAFSNFSKHSIVKDGIIYPTSEHFFQCQKYLTSKDKEAVLEASTPKEAAAIGRDHSRPLRKDWEEVKDDMMRLAITLKFTQHKELFDLLLSTKDSIIIEASPLDAYWGYGPDKKGKNMLGKILMEVREKLDKEILI